MNKKLAELSQLGHLLLPAHRGELEVIDSSINSARLMHTWGTPNWEHFFIFLTQTAVMQLVHSPLVIKMIIFERMNNSNRKQ